MQTKKTGEVNMNEIKKTNIEELIQEAKRAKESGASLSSVFKYFAEKNGKASGSVRNAYYAAMKTAGLNGSAELNENSESNENLSRKGGAKEIKDIIGVNHDEKKPSELFEGLKVNKIVTFKESETDALVKKVLTGITFGKSVRRAISEISRGEKEALRNQNKYRNTLKRDKPRVERLRKEIISEVGKCYDPYLKPPSRDELLDDLKNEINNFYDRIASRVSIENMLLKHELNACRAENARLKSLLERENIKF